MVVRLGTMRSLIADLPPAYFAMVMATGIVSIASQLVGFGAIAVTLFLLNILFYATIWILTVLRAIMHPGQMILDLGDFKRGPGYLTVVAGTCILGSQLIIFQSAYELSALLFLLGLCLWLTLIYALFTKFVVRLDKAAFQESINGSWLLSVVSTQSLSVLGGRLIRQFPPYQEAIAFFSLCTFLAGCVLYLIIITLVFYRLVFFRTSPESFSPPYWISMGAVAITTLAGTILLENSHSSATLQRLIPFVSGLTLASWAIATWWIPLLLVLTIWKHVVRRVRFTYTVEYWSLVFPLGMYTACTANLAAVLDLKFLLPIPEILIYAALFAWTATFAGFLVSIFQTVLSRSGQEGSSA